MTKRCAKGDGSVYQLKMAAALGEYDDANGKRRYVSGKTKAEVKAQLRKLLKARDEDIAVDPENVSVSEYLDKWLEAVEDTVRSGTLCSWFVVFPVHQPGCSLLRADIVRPYALSTPPKTSPFCP